ncbi:MAG: hypothetical protein IKI45_05960, partial [Oscillospiraceae bacterium]|nr:hypothetical protein [Oscillospiraceae bacterium]
MQKPDRPEKSSPSGLLSDCLPAVCLSVYPQSSFNKITYILMSQLSLEDICLSFCHDTALEILALRQQGCGFLPCLMTKILRIYSS